MQVFLHGFGFGVVEGAEVDNVAEGDVPDEKVMSKSPLGELSVGSDGLATFVKLTRSRMETRQAFDAAIFLV